MVGSEALGGGRAFLRTFVPWTELRVDGVSVLCFHGSPISYDHMILATTPHDDLLRMLEGFDHPLMLAGHTHVQLARVINGTLVVNPGSVGLPSAGCRPESRRSSRPGPSTRSRAYRGQPDLGGASPHLL